MKDTISIRELAPQDVPTVCDLAVAAWEPIYAWYQKTMGEELFAALHPDWRAEKAGQVRRACQPDNPAYVLVAEQDGRVVGFVTMYTGDNGVGEIGNNAVHPTAQGKGIAPRLYERAMAYLREQGMRFVRVSTGGDPAHAPARAAYAKVGFDIELPELTLYRAL
jgi:ribosomal protein S18 acetylase RimI-like enzyme